MKLYKGSPWLYSFLNLITPPFDNLWVRLKNINKYIRNFGEGIRKENNLLQGQLISTWSKWIPLTKAALATTGFLSTIACFRYRSIWVRRVPSVIRQSTRMAFARYISVLLFMSFIRELVTIITCCW
jgi:hypothetical protein